LIITKEESIMNRLSNWVAVTMSAVLLGAAGIVSA